MIENNTIKRTLGITAILFYGVHGAALIYLNEAAGLLWVCHIATILVGIGLLFNTPLPNAAGVLWLCYGNGMWILYLAGGGDLYVTSLLTHVGGLVIGIAGIRLMGMPRRSWLWALAGLLVLQQISRFITPARFNVNLAFRVHEGWEGLFPSYGLYMLFLTAVTALVFFCCEKVMGRFAVK